MASLDSMDESKAILVNDGVDFRGAYLRRQQVAADIIDLTKRNLFVEIRRDDDKEPSPPTLVEAYVAIIQPQQCGPLVKRLSRELPLTTTAATSTSAEQGMLAEADAKPLDLSHLKRVKKITASSETTTTNNNNCTEETGVDETDTSSPSKKKKQKTDNNKQRPPLVHLEILLRDVDFFEQNSTILQKKLHHPHQKNNNNNNYPSSSADATTALEFLQNTFEVSSIEKRMVPGRPPESHQEWQDFQTKYWPTTFFAERSKEHLEQQLALSQSELVQMVMGMEQAIEDASAISHQKIIRHHKKKKLGAVIVNPDTSQVVSTSSQEYENQIEQNNNTNAAAINSPPTTTTTRGSTSTSNNLLLSNNPLATSIILAIQGVSRQERTKAISLEGHMKNSQFQKGQYLCTGYDLYTTHEPTPYEAMALVHSRIRRVVFGCSSPPDGGGIKALKIHALPSTNHHYRAFECRTGSSLWRKCQNI